MSFDNLGLEPRLLQAVASMGYTEPTPIQRDAIPLVLEGRDVVGCAQTGTGKTAAFVLPMLQRIRTAGRAALARSSSPPRASSPLQIDEVAARGRPSTRATASPSSTAASATSRRCKALRKRRRHARRHPRPPARPAGARRRATSAASRSSCSTRPTACSTWASGPTCARIIAPAAAPSGRTCCSRRPCRPDVLRVIGVHAARPGARRASPPRTTPIEAIDAVGLPGRRPAEDRPARRSSSTSRTSSACSSSRAPSTAPTAWPRSSTGTASSSAAIHGNRIAVAAPERARRLQERPLPRARRHRHRRPRHRRRRHQPRRELRHAQHPRGLRAPHRPHGPRRQERHRVHAAGAGGARGPARHRDEDRLGAPEPRTTRASTTRTTASSRTPSARQVRKPRSVFSSGIKGRGYKRGTRRR